MSPEEYTSVQQYISSSVPPLLQIDGTPFVPLIAWVASFSASFVCYQVYGGRETDLPDTQKNRLLLDILGEQGRRHLDLSVDGAFSPLDTTPHATLLQEVRHYLEHRTTDSNAMHPLSTPTGAGKPRCTGVISLQSETGCMHQ